MEKTKLLQLLNGLSAWDLRNLEQFLRSPFHNQRTDVLRLFEFYRAQRAQRTPNFSEKAAILAVWPGKLADKVDYPNLRSYLYKLVERYLAIEEIIGDEFLLKMRLARAYERMNKEDNFGRTARDLKAILGKQALRNPDYLRRRFELEYEIFDHVSSRSRMEKTNLEAVGRMLDAHYFAEKLKLTCAQLSFSDVRLEVYDSSILAEMVAFLKQNIEWLSYPAIAVYFYAYLALTEDDNEQHFQKVRRLLEEYYEQFSERETRDIYLLCSNFCIKRSNQGELRYTREGFELYRLGIGQGFLLTEGHLSYHTYINTAAFGITLGEHEWVERFIGEYKTKVAREHQESSYALSLARLRYAQGNFTEAMLLLAGYTTDDPYYFLIAKVLLSRIFYELEEIAALESLLDSIRAYLQRHNNINNSVKADFKHNISLTDKLIRLAPHDAKGRAKLIAAAEKLNRLVDKEWFLKQLGQR